MTTIFLRDLRTGEDADQARVELERGGVEVTAMQHDPATGRAEVETPTDPMTAERVAILQGLALHITILTARSRRGGR